MHQIMKKHLTLFLAFFCLSLTAKGQSSNSFSDDFESYSNNDWLAQTSSVWDTWSGNPSTGGDDVRVTNTDAYSGNNSIYFSPGPGDEDVVLPFGGLYERGQFLYTAMMKIGAGKTAYFNFQGAASVGTTWAVEVTFETDSTVEFSNLTTGTMFQTTYPQDKWFEVKVYINLTRNEWHVTIDDDYRGFFSNSVNKVSHLDLYPIDQNSSFFVDDVSFIYQPPSPDNAGVARLTSPNNAICGPNDIKVRIENNGNNRIDSVRVYWSIDGVQQSPVFVKTAIDTSYSQAGSNLEVTLDSNASLRKGLRKIKVWTAFPNGKADTINFDDTLRITLNAEVRGASMVKASPFQGTFGGGTAAWADTVCVGDTITYGITPPAGYTNADLGTGWSIKALKISSSGKAPVDTQTIAPSGKTNYRLRYVADSTEGDSTFKIEITVSSGSGCDTVLTRYFYVSALPHVAFTATDACLGDLVVVTNKSDGGQSNNYLWNFGDNTGSRFMNTAKFYSSAGTYDITLRATAPSGCRASTTQKVTVGEIPEAKFSIVDACDSSAVHFYDSSTVKNSTIVDYHWEFGDGDTSDVQNPSHVYSTVGTYTARITVTSANGCSDKFSLKAEVHPMPQAAFNSINSCTLDSLDFTNTTSYSGTDALNHDWDFGDGNQASDENPAHIYTTAGNYTVQLKATSTFGCADSIQIPIEIYPLPSVDFSIGNTCLGEITDFTNTSTISSGILASSSWDFGDGASANTTDVAHEFQATGNYEVQLIATSNQGCLDTITKTVEVHPVPTASFAVNDACEDVDVTFFDQSSTGTDTLIYDWQFDDGSSSDMQNPIHQFANAGTYSVKISVTDAEGCIDSISQNIEIFEAPNSVFVVDDACQDAEVTFENQSTTATGLLRNRWDFGDGNNSQAKDPKNTYTQDGNYDVQLVVTNEDGCTDTAVQSITIHPLPEAGFSYSHQGFGRYVFSPDNTSLQSYFWEFGDGDTTSEMSPYHAFADEKNYNVTLTTTDNNSCSSEETIQLSVSTNVAEVDQKVNHIAVYPNPFNDVVNITYELQNAGNVNIEVYGMDGKQMARLVNREQAQGKYQYQFATPEASGVYLLRIVIDGQVYHERLVKAK